MLLIQAQVAQLSPQLAAEYQYGVAVLLYLTLFLCLTNLSLNFTDALVSAFWRGKRRLRRRLAAAAAAVDAAGGLADDALCWVGVTLT